MAGEDDALHVRLSRDEPQGLGEERVAEPVVEGTRRWGSGDDERSFLRARQAQLSEDVRVRLEVAQVDALLEARVAPDLAPGRTLAPGDRLGKRLGQEHQRGEPKGEVIGRLMLEVHPGDDRHTQRAGGDDLGVRVVGQGDVRPALGSPGSQGADAVANRSRLAESARRAGTPDDVEPRPGAPRELHRLGVIAGRDHDAVAELLEAPSDRREQQRVRRVGEVDPDLERSARPLGGAHRDRASATAAVTACTASSSRAGPMGNASPSSARRSAAGREPPRAYGLIAGC